MPPVVASNRSQPPLHLNGSVGMASQRRLPFSSTAHPQRRGGRKGGQPEGKKKFRAAEIQKVQFCDDDDDSVEAKCLSTDVHQHFERSDEEGWNFRRMWKLCLLEIIRWEGRGRDKIGRCQGVGTRNEMATNDGEEGCRCFLGVCWDWGVIMTGRG